MKLLLLGVTGVSGLVMTQPQVASKTVLQYGPDISDELLYNYYKGKYADDDEFLAALPGLSVETGSPGAPWDPLGLSQWRDVKTLRSAELKHGRVAMLAFVGWLWPQMMGTFPVDYVKTTDPVECITAVPIFAWAQIIALCGIAECATLNWKSGLRVYPFYDNIFFDPAKVLPYTKEGQEAMQLKELKNGRFVFFSSSSSNYLFRRMAMIAITGLAVHHFLPGAVPLLGGLK